MRVLCSVQRRALFDTMDSSDTSEHASSSDSHLLSLSEDMEDKKPQMLPSILTSFDDLGPRRASLPTLSLNRSSSYSSSRGYTPQTTSSLANYTFPPASTDEYSSSSSAFSSAGSMNHVGLHTGSNDDWIARPNSTPLRHASFSSTLRISGHRSGKDWPYPSPSHHHLPSANGSPPHHHSHLNSAGSYNTSLDLPPSLSSSIPPIPSPVSSGDQRPQRKRGKLPKETTDYLKSWLHRHSDHPYPSEEEKKQLCHATGLSMSQVSNWMINARRRILAPARPQSGPTTTAPFPNNLGNGAISNPVSAGASLGGRIVSSPQHMSHMQRRTSLPAPSLHSSSYSEGLQLYPPMSLQSYGNGYTSHSVPRNSLPGHGGDYPNPSGYHHHQQQQQYLDGGSGGGYSNTGY
uniref:Homeodomain 2 protein isoform 1 n=1 Tax=Flammulina velutipes TaxID=38945 RepID=A0A6C0N6E3_FLAVE|nr:homeodomain 2 protein isoform 1 [Flammulina velutipes]